MLKPVKRAADKTSISSDEPHKKKQQTFAGKKSNNTKVGKEQKAGKDFKHKTAGNAFKGKIDKSNSFNGMKNKADNSGKQPTDEKKDWAKFKQEKKDLKLKRKQSKDSYEITIEAKQIYEKLKCRKTEKKSQLVEKLYNLFSAGDTIKKIVMAHDTARILQCMLKFATPSLRDQLSEKLLPHTVEMCQSKYSHFCVLRMLKYGSPTAKSKLVDSLFGNIVRLSCHNISSKILDHIYLNVANTQQRNYMRQEFYGELYRKSKDDKVKTLADTYAESNNLKSSILGAVKSNIERVANKQLIDNSLIHAVLLEYLQACDDEQLEEIATALAAHVPHMLSTKDGSQAATLCFYKSPPKNRRAIIKNIKEHLLKIATHEHGYVFLIALLNSLDDTKATKKAIYDHLHDELETLVANQYGRRVVQWLITPSDTNCFHPGFINTIEQGLQYGKKDKELRRKEIFEQIEAPIAEAITQNAKFWLSNSHIGLVTADILKKLSAEHFAKAAEALAVIIAQPNWQVTVVDDAHSVSHNKNKKTTDVEHIIAAATKQRRAKSKKNAPKADTNAEEQQDDDDDDDDDEENDIEQHNKKDAENAEKQEDQQLVPGIEEAGMHIVLKKIIKNDKERSNQQDSSTFGNLLLKHLTNEVLLHWLTVNRACFILLNIIEQNSETTLKQLKEHFNDAQLKSVLTGQQQKSKGAQLLLQKLSL